MCKSVLIHRNIVYKRHFMRTDNILMDLSFCIWVYGYLPTCVCVWCSFACWTDRASEGFNTWTPGGRRKEWSEAGPSTSIPPLWRNANPCRGVQGAVRCCGWVTPSPPPPHPHPPPHLQQTAFDVLLHACAHLPSRLEAVLGSALIVMKRLQDTAVEMCEVKTVCLFMYVCV